MSPLHAGGHLRKRWARSARSASGSASARVKSSSTALIVAPAKGEIRFGWQRRQHGAGRGKKQGQPSTRGCWDAPPHGADRDFGKGGGTLLLQRGTTCCANTRWRGGGRGERTRRRVG